MHIKIIVAITLKVKHAFQEKNKIPIHAASICAKEILWKRNNCRVELLFAQVTCHTPFPAAQKINPFLNLIISANHNKVDGLSANGEIYVKGIVSLL